MKSSKHNGFILFAILAALALLFFLGSCEEIVIEKVFIKGDSIPYPVPGPIQYLPGDTVFLPPGEQPPPECIESDTLNVALNLGDIKSNGEVNLDTTLDFTIACRTRIRLKGYVLIPPQVIKITKDSIVYKDTTIYITSPPPPPDTVEVEVIKIEQRVVYLSTEYLFPGQSVTYIPTDLQKYLLEFDSLARIYNKVLPWGDIVVGYVPAADLPGEGWVSASFIISGWQQVIYLSEALLAEHSRAAIYRELARLQLKKQYSNDVNKIMSPLFDNLKPITNAQLKELFK